MVINKVMIYGELKHWNGIKILFKTITLNNKLKKH